MNPPDMTNAELVKAWNDLAVANHAKILKTGKDTPEMIAVAKEVHARKKAGLMDPAGTNVAYFAYKANSTPGPGAYR